jgi:hypothetical protein
MGGLYYSFNLLFGFISCWVSAYIYLKSDNIKEEQKLDAKTLYGVLSLLIIVAVVSFATFLLTIKRRYVHTFFSTKSGHELARSYFIEGKTDAEKMQIFTNNVRQWQSIYPKVADWVLNNYDRWEEKKEEWYNEAVVASIPDDMLSVRNFEALGGIEGRRRSSFAEQIGASNRG